MQNVRNGFELFFRFYGIDPEEVRKSLEESDESGPFVEEDRQERSSRR
ncbi:MAG: hypothetical protein GF372_14445 [Candidatus Marinimicrobia bacterium]|nr:hypothetical protein [Candidatus Neomarinimicrobiota bacterium]